jgi:tetratricopeptide (TPR) repeat protein
MIEFIVSASVQKMKGDYAMAILEYYQALKYDTTAAILYAIADCYNRLERNDLAIEFALLSVKIEPDFLPSYDILTKSYLSNYDLKNAIFSLEAAISIEETEERLFNLARFYEYQNIEKSKEIYLQLVEKYDNYEALEKLIEFQKFDENKDEY